MKQKIRLKSHRRKSLKQKFLFSLLGVALITVLFLYYISNKIWPILVNYARTDTENIVTEIMSQSVQQKIPELVKLENLFVTNKDENGAITMIDYDPSTINQILLVANQTVQSHLKAIENGDVDYLKNSNISLDNAIFQKIGSGRISAIPIGVITKNALLANLGPTIPVKIHFIGQVTSNVISKISDYGINNVLLTSYIQIEVSAEVLLPLSMEKITINSEIPLSIKMIQGKVPNYYQNGYSNNSPLLSIPMEE